MSTRNETTSPMTREEALAYKAGYEAVNALKIGESSGLWVLRKSLSTLQPLWIRRGQMSWGVAKPFA